MWTFSFFFYCTDINLWSRIYFISLLTIVQTLNKWSRTLLFIWCDSILKWIYQFDFLLIRVFINYICLLSFPPTKKMNSGILLISPETWHFLWWISIDYVVNRYFLLTILHLFIVFEESPISILVSNNLLYMKILIPNNILMNHQLIHLLIIRILNDLLLY